MFYKTEFCSLYTFLMEKGIRALILIISLISMSFLQAMQLDGVIPHNTTANTASSPSLSTYMSTSPSLAAAAAAAATTSHESTISPLAIESSTASSSAQQARAASLVASSASQNEGLLKKLFQILITEPLRILELKNDGIDCIEQLLCYALKGTDTQCSKPLIEIEEHVQNVIYLLLLTRASYDSKPLQNEQAASDNCQDNKANSSQDTKTKLKMEHLEKLTSACEMCAKELVLKKIHDRVDTEKLINLETIIGESKTILNIAGVYFKYIPAYPLIILRLKRAIIAFFGSPTFDLLLQHAIEIRDLNAAFLIALAGADVNCRDSSGKTILEKAIERNDNEVIQWCIKNGADCNIADSDGITPLMKAIIIKSKNTIKALIKANVDVTACDNHKKTVLMYLACNPFNDPQQQSIQNNHPAVPYIKIVQMVVASCDIVNAQDDEGRTALYIAAGCNNHHFIRTLLAIQLVPPLLIDEPTEKGITPLMNAAWNGQQSAFQQLLAGGAALLAVDCKGRTALDWALLNKQAEIVKKIIILPAARDIVLEKKSVLEQKAAEWQRSDMLVLLRQMK